MNQEGLSVKKLTEEQSWLQTGALLVLAFVAFSFGLAAARPVLIPFTLALFLNYLVAPIVDIQMIRLKFSRFIAVTLTLLLMLLLMVLLSSVLLNVVQNATNVATDPQFYRKLEQRLETPLSWFFEWTDFLSQADDAGQPLVPRLIPQGEFIERSHELPEDPNMLPDPEDADPAAFDDDEVGLLPPAEDEPDDAEALVDAAGEAAIRAAEEANEAVAEEMPEDVAADEDSLENAEALSDGDQRSISRTRQFIRSYHRQIREWSLERAGQAGLTVLNLIPSTVLTAIFVGFMLAGRDPYRVSKGIYVEIDRNVRRYIATKFFISALTGLIVWFLLAMLGMRFASMFGLIAFGLNFIPSIGSIIATILPFPFAWVQFDSTLMVALVIFLPGAVQLIIGNIIEPKIMGDGLQLHPVTILLALAFFGMLWGLVGMLLAAPITASIRIVLMRFTTTEPIGKLMAGILPEEEDATGGAGI